MSPGARTAEAAPPLNEPRFLRRVVHASTTRPSTPAAAARPPAAANPTAKRHIKTGRIPATTTPALPTILRRVHSRPTTSRWWVIPKPGVIMISPTDSPIKRGLAAYTRGTTRTSQPMDGTACTGQPRTWNPMTLTRETRIALGTPSSPTLQHRNRHPECRSTRTRRTT
jgi:hypothetical protein